MPKRSPIHKIDDNTFTKAVQNNFSIRAVLLDLGMNAAGNAYSVFARRVKKLSLDTSHFTGKGHLKGKSHNWNYEIPLDEILVSESDRTLTSKTKRRLIKSGLLKPFCQECGLGEEWNSKPITLQLDHVNGHKTDHRISNLRLLCPNCHSQTHTFAGKNKK